MKKHFTIIAIASAMIAVTIIGGILTVSAINTPRSDLLKMDKGGVYGTIASIQSQEGDAPGWVLSGLWNTNMINETKADFNQSNRASFDATFSMVMLNGSAKHQHRVSNFSLTDMTNANNTASYKGLATVTMKTGPVTNVPVDIKIYNNNVMSIWFDPNRVKNHFGVSPIYGAVGKEKE